MANLAVRIAYFADRIKRDEQQCRFYDSLEKKELI